MGENRQNDDKVGRDIYILNIAFLFLSAVLVFVGFVAGRSEYVSEEDAYLAAVRDHAVDRALALESTIKEAVYQVESLRASAEAMLNGPEVVPPSPLFPLLRDTASGQAFTLDHLPPGTPEDSIGNVYGLGSLADLDSATRRRITIGLWSFIQQQVAMKATPHLAWIYLDYADHYYFMSPWMDTGEMVEAVGAPDLQTLIRMVPELDFFRMGRPENNPERRGYWTPVYQDAAGKGLMVTYGVPVYEGDGFQGVVAADLTLEFMRGFLDELTSEQVGAMIVSRNADAAPPSVIVTASGVAQPQDGPDLPASGSRKFEQYGQRLVLEMPFAVVPWSLVVEIDDATVRRQAVRRLLPWFGGSAFALVSLLAMYVVLRNRLQERHRMTRVLQELADTDELTGVDNRRSYMKKVAYEVSRARRYGAPLAVLMLDIDHFKKVNDTWGHPTGDAAIKAFAAVCRGTVREVDVVGRLGGEEFSVALPGTGIREARAIAERILEATRKIEVRSESGGAVAFTCSIGVSTLEPGDEDANAMFSRADAALLQAKRAGRDCVRPHPGASPERRPGTGPQAACPHPPSPHRPSPQPTAGKTG